MTCSIVEVICRAQWAKAQKKRCYFETLIFFARKMSRKIFQCAIILARSLIIRLTAVATLPHYESVQQGKQIQLKKNLIATQRCLLKISWFLCTLKVKYNNNNLRRVFFDNKKSITYNNCAYVLWRLYQHPVKQKTLHFCCHQWLKLLQEDK